MSLFEKPSKEDPTGKPPQSGEQRIVTLLKYLFQQFASSDELDTEQMRTAKMKEFVQFCLVDDVGWYHAAEERTAVKDTLGVLDEDIEAVWTMFTDPWNAVALLLPLWHMLALSGQPPVKHIPAFMQVSVTLAWHPGATQEKALQIQVPTKWSPGSPLTNGFLCALLKDQFDGIVQTFAGNGLDALYEKYAVSTADPGKPSSLPAAEKKREGFGL